MTAMFTNVTRTTNFLVIMFTLITKVTNILTVTNVTVVTMVTSFHWLLRFPQHTGSSFLGKFPVLFGSMTDSGVPRGGTPPPEIPKTLQNLAKLSPIAKTVKNC